MPSIDDICLPCQEIVKSGLPMLQLKKKLQDTDIIVSKFKMLQKLHVELEAEKLLLEERLQTLKLQCLLGHVKPLQILLDENAELAKLGEGLQEERDQLSQQVEDLQVRLQASEQHVVQLEELLKSKEAQLRDRKEPEKSKSQQTKSAPVQALREELAAKEAYIEIMETRLGNYADKLLRLRKTSYFQMLSDPQKVAIKFFCSFSTQDDSSDSSDEETLDIKPEPIVPMMEQTLPSRLVNQCVQTPQVRTQASSTQTDSVTPAQPQQKNNRDVKRILQKMCNPFGQDFKLLSPPTSPRKPCNVQPLDDVFIVDASELEENFKVTVRIPAQRAASHWVKTINFSFDLGRGLYGMYCSYNTEEHSIPTFSFYGSGQNNSELVAWMFGKHCNQQVPEPSPSLSDESPSLGAQSFSAKKKKKKKKAVKKHFPGSRRGMESFHPRPQHASSCSGVTPRGLGPVKVQILPTVADAVALKMDTQSQLDIPATKEIALIEAPGFKTPLPQSRKISGYRKPSSWSSLKPPACKAKVSTENVMTKVVTDDDSPVEYILSTAQPSTVVASSVAVASEVDDSPVESALPASSDVPPCSDSAAWEAPETAEMAEAAGENAAEMTEAPPAAGKDAAEMICGREMTEAPPAAGKDAAEMICGREMTEASPAAGKDAAEMICGRQMTEAPPASGKDAAEMICNREMTEAYPAAGKDAAGKAADNCAIPPDFSMATKPSLKPSFSMESAVCKVAPETGEVSAGKTASIFSGIASDNSALLTTAQPLSPTHVSPPLETAQCEVATELPETAGSLEVAAARKVTDYSGVEPEESLMTWPPLDDEDGDLVIDLGGCSPQHIPFQERFDRSTLQKDTPSSPDLPPISAELCKVIPDMRLEEDLKPSRKRRLSQESDSAPPKKPKPATCPGTPTTSASPQAEEKKPKKKKKKLITSISGAVLDELGREQGARKADEEKLSRFAMIGATPIPHRTVHQILLKIHKASGVEKHFLTLLSIAASNTCTTHNIVATLLAFILKSNPNPLTQFARDPQAGLAISPFEEKMVCFLLHSYQRSNKLSTMAEGFLRAIPRAMGCKESTGMFGKTSLVRIGAAFCRGTNSPTLLYRIMIRLLKMNIPFLPYMFASVAAVWPLIFLANPKSPEFLSKLMLNVVSLRNTGHNRRANREVESTLTRLYGTFAVDVHSREFLVELATFSRNLDHHEPITKGLWEAGLESFFAIQGWDWVSSSLVESFLQREFLDKAEAAVACHFRLLEKILVLCPSDKLPALESLLLTLTTILSNDKDPFVKAHESVVALLLPVRNLVPSVKQCLDLWEAKRRQCGILYR